MRQKVIQVGNSLALTIPKSFVNETGFQAGDEVIVQQDTDNKTLLITTPERAGSIRLRPELFSWLERIEKQYAEAIKALAKK